MRWKSGSSAMDDMDESATTKDTSGKKLNNSDKLEGSMVEETWDK